MKKFPQPVLAAIAGVLLAACGQPGAISTRDSADFIDQANAQREFRVGESGVKPVRHRGSDSGAEKTGKQHHHGLFDGLNLTDEQRMQFRAIAEKYRAEGDGKAAGKGPGRKLAELLKADSLDVEALKAALTERGAPRRHGSPSLEMLKEQRAVLTDVQRDALIARLKSKGDQPQPEHPPEFKQPDPEKRAKRITELATRFKLTDTQKAAFVAFEAAKLATKPGKQAKPDPVARQAALIAFLESGDTSKLEALAPPTAAPQNFPVDAFIALAQTLDANQRQALLLPHGHKGKGEHHKKGHHGR